MDDVGAAGAFIAGVVLGGVFVIATLRQIRGKDD